MQTVKLEKFEWDVDTARRLGEPGGFGEVFMGSGPAGEVAIKRLNLNAGAAAHREMQIGECLADHKYNHVVPIFDYGLDANGGGYYLVMPVCERSLQEHLRDNGPLTWSEARPIVSDILAGLHEVSSIVHRDLKPGNVLFRENRWQIADFGIAKFVEDATSLETLRQSLTPPYAAPEQWLGERPTGGTDIYALGCIIYALLTGRPPFSGSIDDVRDAHLHSTPPSIPGADPRLVSLLNHMLRKAQAVRPSRDRVNAIIGAIELPLPSNGSRASLAAADQSVSAAEAQIEAERVAAVAARIDWKTIGEAGIEDFPTLMDQLSSAILKDAPTARQSTTVIYLGPATLKWLPPEMVDRRIPTRPGQPTEGIWNVAAQSRLEVSCVLNKVHYHEPDLYKFAVTLAFAKTPTDPNFRWREISFYRQFSSNMNDEPTALPPSNEQFFQAFSLGMGGIGIAHGPFTIDAEDIGAFVERWTGLFAKAAHGNLRPPNQLPLAPYFYT